MSLKKTIVRLNVCSQQLIASRVFCVLNSFEKIRQRNREIWQKMIRHKQPQTVWVDNGTEFWLAFTLHKRVNILCIFSAKRYLRLQRKKYYLYLQKYLFTKIYSRNIYLHYRFLGEKLTINYIIDQIGSIRKNYQLPC